MSHKPIVVEETHGRSLTGGKYNLLRSRPDLATGANLGGRFAVPLEFDQSRNASAFYPEGNESFARQQDEIIQGTSLIAEGWKVWKYPECSSIPELDDEGNQKKDETGRKIFCKHPNAGRPHKVPPLDRDGVVYVLHYRSLEVQNQVNQVYGDLSREAMVNEIRGETIGGTAPDDPGMLSDQVLKREIGKEQEIEQLDGRSTVVHSAVEQSAGRVSRKKQKLSQ